MNEKEIRRTMHGIAGIKCPCCNRWGCSPRKSKPLERRHIRRKIRSEIKGKALDLSTLNL